ncbi:ABC transporter ATP-binding protein [Methanospirillum hungatei]|uniref:ABC transporter ATP-binding protein n=1 Tax=Methanospirillum hungatei TaxID=2203 RepID=UPI0026F14EAB|nr:ABC transporter ATP-binding protein [Methanospirillum hungatei]MCA1917489.1 ABC transporter ATP-binding protein [Methanospirillum hungatei]
MLQVSNLKTSFRTPEGIVKAVDSIDISLRKREKVGLIGETGCGKTVFGMSVVRLLPHNTSISGKVSYKGKDLMTVPESHMQNIRGSEISFILQNPSVSLNPLMRVGGQIEEAVRKGKNLSAQESRKETLRLLKEVNFQDPEYIMNRYPHELSGGMKQRVMIAIGIASEPDLIIADEPTKALDKGNKKEILSLLSDTAERSSMIMITHDLAAASELCDRILVMYDGEIVEDGPCDEILSDPLHPYTIAFIKAHPKNGCKAIPGSSPSLIDLPSGCRFHPRCPDACAKCRTNHPDLSSGHSHHRKNRCHCH